jgi:hypothetical protein
VNREGVLGLFLVALLLGGVFLLTRRPAASYTSAPQGQGNIQFVPAEPRRYQNKEIRQIEYNEDHLPIKIIITRDYAVT